MYGSSLTRSSGSSNEESSTFSIVAFDPTTNDLSVAVQSKYFSVGAVVPWAEAGVGAIATQAMVNVSYGPEGLKLLSRGLSVQEAIRELTKDDKDRETRQIGVVDSYGNSASYTGLKCVPWAGDRQGRHYAAQGNILENEGVVSAMSEVFESSSGELAERLVSALEAGQSAGGDARGVQSAALLVVRKGKGRAGQGDRYIDLRVEDHQSPIAELRRLLNLNYSFDHVRDSHALMDEDRCDEALPLALKAVERSPEYDMAHMALCRAHFETGDRVAAAREFGEAVRLNVKTLNYVKRMPRWSFIVENKGLFKGP